VSNGFVSLALRAGSPIVLAGSGILIGFASGSLFPGTCSQGWFCFGPAAGGALLGYMIGLGAGFVAASVVDIAVLSFDRPARTASTARRALPLQLAPSFALPRDASGRTAPTFRLVGTF